MGQDDKRVGIRRVDRRQFLALTGGSALAALVAACGSGAPPAATPAPAKPAAAPTTAPAAPAPTSAPAAAAAPTKAAEPAVGPAEKPKVVFSTWNPNYANEAPLHIALDKGFFKEEGLDLQIVETDQGLEGAVGGSIDIAHQDTGPLLDAAVKGVKAKAISPWRTGEFLMFVVNDKIKKPEDMVGKTLINYPIGDRFFLLHTQMLKEAGYDTDKFKPNWIQMAGGSDPKAQAFVDGKVDGTYILPRHKEMALKAGGRLLYEKLQTWPQESLAVTDAFAAKNPNTIVHFLRAIIKAQQVYSDKSNKDYVIKLMTSKGFNITDIFKNAYDFEPVQFSPDMGFDMADMTKLTASYMPNPPQLSVWYDLKYLTAAQKSLNMKVRPAL